MEHSVIELRKMAKQRGLTGYSSLRKLELISKLKFRMKTDFISILERFLRPNVVFDEGAKPYLNSLISTLASRIKNVEFVESLGYLGEAALEAAEKHKFTDVTVEGFKNTCISNIIIYIISELVDLLNYATIDKKRDRILLSDVERVIKNDHDLNIAFN